MIKALNSATLQRKPLKGLIHHSDFGSQFTSFEFYKAAGKHRIVLSHGKTGVSYDNADMDSFFHILKIYLYFYSL